MVLGERSADWKQGALRDQGQQHPPQDLNAISHTDRAPLTSRSHRLRAPLQYTPKTRVRHNLQDCPVKTC